jgi:hypothetical protein
MTLLIVLSDGETWEVLSDAVAVVAVSGAEYDSIVEGLDPTSISEYESRALPILAIMNKRGTEHNSRED